MKYQVRQVIASPVAFEAYQINDGDCGEVPQWMKEAANKTQGTIGSFYQHGNECYVNEFEKGQVVKPGDWILKEDGSDELAVCSGALFASMYECSEDSLDARVAKLEERVAKLEEFVCSFTDELSDPKAPA